MKFYNEIMERDIKTQQENPDIKYNIGKTKVLYNYHNMAKNKHTFQADTIILNDIFLSDYIEMLSYFRECGINEIIITDNSSGLVEVLHYILLNGGELLKAVTLEYEDELFKETSYKKGLRIKI